MAFKLLETVEEQVIICAVHTSVVPSNKIGKIPVGIRREFSSFVPGGSA
jgi:hypothetical protein